MSYNFAWSIILVLIDVRRFEQYSLYCAIDTNTTSEGCQNRQTRKAVPHAKLNPSS